MREADLEGNALYTEDDSNHTFSGHTVLFGMLLASRGLDGVVIIWDVLTGTLKHKFKGPGEVIESQHAAATVEVMRKYGDHLYDKQDFDESMQQYIRTIGQLEHFYVIQKFLDAQQNHNLTIYLERLHENGLATAAHTTLLLICYTKVKDLLLYHVEIHNTLLELYLSEDLRTPILSRLSRKGTMKRDLEQTAGDHDQFFQLVQNSEDGFSVIADYFKRVIFNKIQNPASGATNELVRSSMN